MSVRLLNIARTSLLAQRSALAIIGQNTANVETPGYVRQRPVLSALPGGAGSSGGGGVRLVDVQRLADELLIAQTRYQSGWLGQESATAEALGQVESIFTDLLDGGMSGRIEEMFDAWTDVGLEPTSAAARSQLVQRSELAASSIAARWQGLNDLRVEIDQRLSVMVEQANNLAVEIADANVRVAAAVSPSARNNLVSQRDELVNQLADLCGAEVIRQEDDVVDVVIGGLRIVELGQTTELSLVPDPGQPGMHLVQLGDITMGSALRGEMAGRLAVRDGLIPDYMAGLDTLAQTLADEVNAVHAAGWDLNGDAGGEFFTYGAGGPAASLRVREEIAADAFLIAASCDATASGDGTNALAIDDLRNSQILAGGTETFSQYAGDLVAEIGVDSAAAMIRLDGRQMLVDNLRQTQASRTGVSLDEEALDLIRYQQAYNASSRMVSVALEMMDEIIALK